MEWQAELFGRALSARDLEILRRIPCKEDRAMALAHLAHLHSRGAKVLRYMARLFALRRKAGRRWKIGSDRIWGSCAERWRDFPGNHEHRAFYVRLLWHLRPDLRREIILDGPQPPACLALFEAGFPKEGWAYYTRRR